MTLFKNPELEDKSAEYLSQIEQKFTKDGKLDVDALKKGAAEKDWHIDNLENEMKAAREELNKRTTYEELMAKIEATRNISRSSESETEQDESLTNDSVDTEALIDRLVEEKLSKSQQKSVHEQNTAYVVQKLQEAWGKDYVSKLREIGKEIGWDDQKMQVSAATDPKAFLRMVNPEVKVVDKQTGYTPPRSTTRVSDTSNTMNYSYFEKLRKSSPGKKLPEDMNRLMWKLAAEKGPDFYK